MARQPNECASSESESNPNNVALDVTDGDQSMFPNFFRQSLTDPLFAHISASAPIRELVRLMGVSKQFATLICKNSIFTELARLEDESKDWYFPVRFTCEQVDPAPDASNERKLASISWKWDGVHHPSTQAHTLPSLEQIPKYDDPSTYLSIRLPSLDHIPYYKFKYNDPSSVSILLGTSGSLLLSLLQTKSDTVGRVWNDKSLIHPNQPSPWLPLLVINPLTKESKLVPAPADAKSTRWDYHGARLHLVEDECFNAYTIVLLFRDRLLVYKSASNCWTSSVFEEHIPWGFRRTIWVQSTDYYDVPHAIVGGKLLYGELEVDGIETAKHRLIRDNAEMLSKGVVKVFEVDYTRGTWKRTVQLSLQDFIPRDLHDSIWDFGFQGGSYGIEVVNCNSGVYIVIPARLNLSMTIPESIRDLYNLKDGALDELENKTYEDFCFLPYRFYVLQVNGVGLPFGQAFIKCPPTAYRRAIEIRSLLHLNPRTTYSKSMSWYRVRGWGRVINIVIGNCFVEYDVVSGLTTTQVMPELFSSEMYADMSYRPSLYRKP